MSAAGHQPPIGRRLVLGGARRIGADEHLRRAYGGMLALRAGARARRNWRDDDQMRLLAAAVLTPWSNCIDIGANEGVHLSMFTELAPHGHHIAYEPIPVLADGLAGRFPSVEVRRSALSNTPGQTEFVVNTDRASRSSMRDVGYPAAETVRISVPRATLDGDLPDDYRVDLLKLDVEGAELLVLEGARARLRRDRPLLLFEHQESTASYYDTGPGDLYDLLAEELDMRIFDMDGSGPYGRERFQAVYDQGSMFNFFAR